MHSGESHPRLAVHTAAGISLFLIFSIFLSLTAFLSPPASAAEQITQLYRGGAVQAAEPYCAGVNTADGSVWIGTRQTREIIHLAANGTELWRGVAPSPLFPFSISVNKTDGSVWIGCYSYGGGSSVVHLAANGTQLWRGNAFNWPQSVAVNPTDGSCWVADTENDQVVHLSASGVELSRGGGYIRPVWVSVNPNNGECWVADEDGGSVARLAADGSEVQRYGFVSRPGSVEVNPDDNTFWVLDHGGAKVVHRRLDGTNICEVLGFAGGGNNVSVSRKDGSCWVGDWAHDEVFHLASDGTVLSRTTGFQFVYRVAANGSDGTCWAVDISTYQVTHLSASGTVIWQSPRGFLYPISVSASMTDGSVLVADPGTDVVARVAANGSDLWRVAFSDPQSVSVDQVDGTFWLAEGGTDRILHISAADGTTRLSEALGFLDPSSVSVNHSDGTCWVADYGHSAVVHLAANGITELSRKGGFYYPRCVSANPTDGTCWVADQSNRQVVHLAANGTTELSRKSGFNNPVSVAVNPIDGTCWVADAWSSAVIHLAADGMTELSRTIGLTDALAVSVSTDGSCWAGTSTEVVHLGADGRIRSRRAGFSFPFSLSVNLSDGTCWAADYDHRELVHLGLTPNLPSVANPDALTVHLGTPATGLLTASNPDGDPLTFSIVTNGYRGTAVITNPSTGAFTYTPGPGELGGDTFLFRVNDGCDDSNVAPICITITSVLAQDDAATTDEDTSVTIPVLANDSDLDGHGLSVAEVAAPTRGQAVVNADGTVTYTPNANYNGTDFFTYTAADSRGNTDTALVTITVNPVNDLPVAQDDSAVTYEDIAVPIAVLANDYDNDGDPLTITDLTLPANGQAVINGTRIDYTPNADYNGSDSFTYTMSAGGDTATATVNLTVVAVDDTPKRTEQALQVRGQFTVFPWAVAVDRNDGSVWVACYGSNRVVHMTAQGEEIGTLTSLPGPYALEVNQTDGSCWVALLGSREVIHISPDGTILGRYAALGQPCAVAVNSNDGSVWYSDVGPNQIVHMTSSGGVLSRYNGVFAYGVSVNQADGSCWVGDISSGQVIHLSSTGGLIWRGGAYSGPYSVSVNPNDGSVWVASSGGGMVVHLGPNGMEMRRIFGFGQPESLCVNPADGSVWIANTQMNQMVHLDPIGNELSRLQRQQKPRSVAVNPTDGTCWFVSYDSNRVEQLAGDGSYLQTIGQGLTTPQAVSVNSADGTCWVADTGNNRVLHLDVDGTQLWVGNNLLNPQYLSVNHNDGSCWVSLSNEVVHLASDGAELWRGSPINAPSGLSVNQSDGSCWIPDLTGGQVVHLAADGSELWRGSGFSQPRAVSVNSTDGSVWVANETSSEVVHLSANGIELWRGGGFHHPRSVSANPVDGSCWVADCENSQVVHLAADGTELSRTSGISQPFSVSVNPTDGSCWVAAWSGQEVVRLAPDGSVAWRGSGFSTPYSVSANSTDGSCWVADTGNHRVVRLSVAANQPPVASDGVLSTNEDTPASGTLAAADPENDPLTFSIVSNGTLGSAAITNAATGAYAYTPNADVSGSDTFTFKTTDGAIDSNVATVTVTIAPVHDLPTAVDDSATTSEDTAVTISVTANDIDPDGDGLDLIEWEAPPAHGSAVGFDAQGRVTYMPEPNFSGTDSFRYRYNDGANVSVATITVTVTAVNDPPVAVDDYITVAEDGIIGYRALINDTDPDGDRLTISSSTPPAHGQHGQDSSTIYYIPDPNYNGEDSLTYTICDEGGATATAAVHVTVTPVNDPPIAGDDSASTAEDTPVTIDVLANDTSIDGRPMTVVIHYAPPDDPAHGQIVLNPDQTITYTPDANYNGPDTFRYHCYDSSPGESVFATVTVSVTAVNDPPAATDDTVTTAKNLPAIISPLANDSDAEGDQISMTGFTQPSHGQVAANGDGSLTYTPQQGYIGGDSFEYTISDSQGATDTGTVSIVVVEPFVIQVGSAQAGPSETLTIPVTFSGPAPHPELTADCLSNLKSVALAELMYLNDYEENFPAATTAAELQAALAPYVPDMSVFFCPETGRPYLPNPALAGRSMSDVDNPSAVKMLWDEVPHSDGTKCVAYVDGHVMAEQTASEVGTIALRLTYNVGRPGLLTLANVRKGSGLPSGWEIAYESGPGTDEVSVQIYAPAGLASPLSSDSANVVVLEFDFTVAGIAEISPGETCGLLPTEVSLLSPLGSPVQPVAALDGLFTVAQFNRPPVAVDDSAATDEDTPVTISVLANDTDADGDALTITEVTPPTSGQATINGDGTITYEPVANYSGTASFTYTVSDGSGSTDTAAVTVTITAVNDPPLAVDNYISVDEDAPVTDYPVTNNDTDVEDFMLTVCGVTQPTHGTASLSIDPRGVFYAPEPNFYGSDSFTYTVNDSFGATATATVHVTVNPVNDPPVAGHDTATTDEDTAVTIAVLANDSDVDDATLSISATTPPAHGSATVNADGTITYTPFPDYNGSDSFTYTVTDGNGGSATATVNITVTSVNDPPAAQDDAAVAYEDVWVPMAVLSNDSDVEDTLTITALSQPANGQAVINGARIDYTPNADYNGSDSFTYTVSDGNGATDTAVVTLTVVAIDDTPTVIGEAWRGEGFPYPISVSVNQTDGSCWVANAYGGEVVHLAEGGSVLQRIGGLNYPFSVSVNSADGSCRVTCGGSGQVVALQANGTEMWRTAPGTFGFPEQVSVSPIDGSCWVADSAGAKVVHLAADGSEIWRATFSGNPVFSVAVDAGDGSCWVGVPAFSAIIHYSANDAELGRLTGFAFPWALSANPADGSLWVGDSGANRVLHLSKDGVEMWRGTNFNQPLSVSVNPTDGSCWVADSNNNQVVRLAANGTELGRIGGFGQPWSLSVNRNDGSCWVADTGNNRVVHLRVSIDQPPVANDSAVVTDEDMSVSGALSASEPNGQPLTFSIVTNGALGTATITNPASGAFTYAPNANLSGTDTFTFKVNDGYFDSNIATVTVTIAPVNDPPTAVDDSAATAEDTPVSVAVLANDSDPEIDPLIVTEVTDPPHGSAVINADNTVTYTPDANYNGSDSFGYTITDGSGATASASVNITVIAVNDPPIAVNDTIVVNEDGGLGFNPLANDSDPENNTLTVVSAWGAAHGTTSVNPNGVHISYVPAPNYNGPDSFLYKVSDGSATATATVNVTVLPVNDPPKAVNDEVTANEDTETAIAVLANDSDPENDALFVTTFSQPSHGMTALNPDMKTIRYTPYANWNGADSFTYTIRDQYGLTATATVNVTVVPVTDAADEKVALWSGTGFSGVRSVSVNPIDGSCWVAEYDADRVTKLAVSGTALFHTSAIYPDVRSVSVNTADGSCWLADAAGGGRVVLLRGADGVGIWSGTGLSSPESVCDNGLVWIADTANNRVRHLRSYTPSWGSVTGLASPRSVSVDSDRNGCWAADTGNNRVILINGSNDAVIRQVPGFNQPWAVAANSNDGSVWVADTGNNRLVHVDVNGPIISQRGGFSAPKSIAVNQNDGSVWVADTGNNRIVHLRSDGVELWHGGGFSGPLSVSVNSTDGACWVADTGNNRVVRLGINHPPVTQSFSGSTPEDTPIYGTLHGSDPDGQALTYAIVQQGTLGQVSLASPGSDSFRYAPYADKNGTDYFLYRANDGYSNSNTAKVTITIAPVNDPPRAKDDTAGTTEDTAVTIPVLANDYDPENDAFTLSAITQPAHGGAVMNADGTVTYTPSADYSGSDSFTYTISDASARTSTATVNVTITAVNDPPVAWNDRITTAEDTASVMTSQSLLANDRDPENDALTLVDFTQPAHGGVVRNADGSLTYTPAPNYNGSDSFTYTVSDGNGGTATATVEITVTPVNDPPVAVDDEATVAEDTVSGPIRVLANDSDLDGDALTVWDVPVRPSHGSVEWSIIESAFFYTPNLNYAGPDSFTYEIRDNYGGIATATVNITVTPVNDAPVAVDDETTMAEDTVSGPIYVMANDSDPDGDTLSMWGRVIMPSFGSLEWVPAQSAFFYTPNPDRHGPDYFTYRIVDGHGGSAMARVNITVTPVNDPPMAEDDSVTTNEDTPIMIVPFFNDSDIDGLVLSVIEITQPSHGLAVINPDQRTLTYTPAANYNGADFFLYTISDGAGGTDQATVNIAVTSVNDPPVAVQDSAATAEDTPVTIPVLANDTDPENDALSVTGFSEPSHGAAVVNPDGTITYSPASNYSGSDSFTYTASDGNGGSAIAAVYITVTAVNDPPAAVDDLLTVLEDGPAGSVNVLTNDSDVEGNALTVTGYTQPAHGSVMEDESPGVLTYTPTSSNYNGPDAFTYTVSDGHGGTATATVNVTVTAVNDAPIAGDDIAATSEDAAIIITVLANDLDLDGDPLEVNSGLLPEQRAEHGSITFNPDNTITYTPDANFHGTDLFGYYVEDPSGATSLAIVTVTITPANDPPVAVNDSAATLEDTAVTVSVLSNDSDLDGDALTVTEVTSLAHGTAVINPNGSVTYLPALNYFGPDSFTYTICDGTETATATVSISVAGVNDPPIAFDMTVTTDEDTPITVNASSDDPDGPGRSFALVSSFGAQSVEVYDAATGVFVFNPQADFAGDAWFTFKVNDGLADSNIATVFVTVNPVNDPPTADADGPYEITVGEPLSLDGSGSSDPEVPADSIVAYEWDTDGDGLFEFSTSDPVCVVTWEDLWAWRSGAIIIGEPFTITLRVTDSDGATAAASTTVTVLNSPPEANAGGPYTTTFGQGLTLDGSGSVESDSSCGDAITEWRWDIRGDGTWDKVETTPGTFVTWPELSGLLSPLVIGQPYPITLQVTDSNGATATAVTAITVVNTSPTAAFTFAPASPTTADTVNFTDGSSDLEGAIASWSWDFGDGATAISQNPSHQYSASGTYSVSLTVTDAQGAAGNMSHDVVVSQAGNTQPGSDVSVTDPVAGVSLTFSQVTSPGETTIATSSTGPGKPDGFWFQDLFFEISTTAGYTAPVSIAIHYDDELIPGGEQREAQLRLMHSDGSGGWTDVTTSVDTVNNIIYGEVTSFSWFAIGWPEYDWLGFQPPIEGATRPFKRGSTIPVKFRIAKNGQPVTNAVATLKIYYLVEGIPSGEAEVISTASGDLGNQFRYSADGDLYIFNLSTKDRSYLERYTYLAEVTLDDGSVHSVQFSLK